MTFWALLTGSDSFKADLSEEEEEEEKGRQRKHQPTTNDRSKTYYVLGFSYQNIHANN